MTVYANHDPFLVAVSLLVAGTAGYTALDLASRTRATGGWIRRGWLAASAIAMGGGIWAMHFIAMLAMSLPGVDAVYDPGLTALSILLAVAATGTAFFIVCSQGPRPVPLAQSALFMGAGIVAMHYTGMAAIQTRLTASYDIAWVAISVLIAIGASAAALWLAFEENEARPKLWAGLVMGVAISGMHFAGMRAVSFSEGASHLPHVHAVGLDHNGLGIAVAAITFVILFFALVASRFDRRFAELARREADGLRRSEGALRALYRRTPLPLHAIDATGRIEEASDAWLDLLGYSRREVVGRPFADFIAAGTPGQSRLDLSKLLESGELRDLECRLATRSGAVLDVLISARTERDADGRPLRALCGIVDVTAHRRAEEALRQAQKMEALGQLTGGVAHDFNNLLAVIVGNLERLRRHLASDPVALPLARNAAAAAERGVLLTQRMLAFARKQRLEPEAIALPALLAGMTDLLRQSLGPEVQIRTALPADLPAVQADPIQLELALLNLAVNGRDAMPGGGTITVSGRSVPPGPGAPGALAGVHAVCIAVADEGEGMDDATLARACDPFFTTKAPGKGTGLGLSMVHGFAEQSGGALHLASRKGKGSTAELWLPAAAAARPADTVTPLPVPADGSARPALRVLAVDDDRLVLMNTTGLLEDLGHAVVEAYSGAEALAILRDGAAVDLVITDQGMPDMTGTQLCAAIAGAWPDLPLLIATGYAELPAGAGHVRIGKPFDTLALAAAIERALQAPRGGAPAQAAAS